MLGSGAHVDPSPTLGSGLALDSLGLRFGAGSGRAGRGLEDVLRFIPFGPRAGAYALAVMRCAEGEGGRCLGGREGSAPTAVAEEARIGGMSG